ncbi:MAG: hypothetical protein RR719_09685, partial [Akkermansia sp.]
LMGSVKYLFSVDHHAVQLACIECSVFAILARTREAASGVGSSVITNTSKPRIEQKSLPFIRGKGILLH